MSTCLRDWTTTWAQPNILNAFRKLLRRRERAGQMEVWALRKGWRRRGRHLYRRDKRNWKSWWTIMTIWCVFLCGGSSCSDHAFRFVRHFIWRSLSRSWLIILRYVDRLYALWMLVLMSWRKQRQTIHQSFEMRVFIRLLLCHFCLLFSSIKQITICSVNMLLVQALQEGLVELKPNYPNPSNKLGSLPQNRLPKGNP